MRGLFWLLVVSMWISSIASLKQYLKVPLHGNESTGYYDVYMILGGQRQRLTADTGSHRLVVQCGRCSTCFDGELQNYKDTQSSTNKHVKCNDRSTYCSNRCFGKKNLKDCRARSAYGSSEQASHGYEGTMQIDELQFYERVKQEGESFQAEFLCADTLFGFKKERSNIQNGIIGLGPDPDNNVLYKWFNRGGMDLSKVIGMCLARNGGYLQMGQQSEDPNHKEEIKFNFSSSVANYKVPGVNSVSMQDTNLEEGVDMATMHLMFDSGAPYFIVPSAMREKILKKLEKDCKENMLYCEMGESGVFKYFILQKQLLNSYDEVANRIFKQFKIKVQGKELIIRPSEYMNKPADQSLDNYYIAYFYAFGENYPQNQITIGVPFWIDKKIIFDLQTKTMRILTQVECQYSESFQIIFRGTSLGAVLSYLMLIAVLTIFCLWGKIMKKLYSFKCFRKNNVQFVEEVHSQSEYKQK